MTFAEHQIIIIGGGPTGLMLAGELALAGAEVAIVERRENQELDGSRAGGLHSRALELLDQRGIAGRFIAQGIKHHSVAAAGIILDAGDRPTRHNYTLGLWQEKIERILAGWIAELPVTFYRGRTAASVAAGPTGVEVRLEDGAELRGRYLVGCDGGRSLVRKAAGIGFSGYEPQASYLIFEGELRDEAPIGIRYGPRGLYALGRLDDGPRFRGVITEPQLERGGGAREADLRAALIAAYGSDLGVHAITWISRFTDAARQAELYRKGPILLAGDAAHVHSPVGGQGLNIGLQDAVNLGWKLAQVAKGLSPDSLLDSYHAERHPVGAELLKLTMALTALNRDDDHMTALRSLVAEMLSLDQARLAYAAKISGLDIRYGPEGSHPLLGRRMPDLDLLVAGERTRLFEMMHDARPLLIDFGRARTALPAPWRDRIKALQAECDGDCSLPVIGLVPLPSAVLIRPDGHVAWTDAEPGPELEEALTHWFGG